RQYRGRSRRCCRNEARRYPATPCTTCHCRTALRPPKDKHRRTAAVDSPAASSHPGSGRARSPPARTRTVGHLPVSLSSSRSPCIAVENHRGQLFEPCTVNTKLHTALAVTTDSVPLPVMTLRVSRVMLALCWNFASPFDHAKIVDSLQPAGVQISVPDVI